MPRLWTATVESHRQEVREAILAATGRLVTEHGLLSVSMTQVADSAGIGRATLYKYFSDVEQILQAWHHDRVNEHLSELKKLESQPGPAVQRLKSVLEAYGQIARQRHHSDDQLAAVLHADRHTDSAEQQLRAVIADLIRDGASAGNIRADIPADELASYCLYALQAGAEHDPAGQQRILDLIWTSLRS